MTGPVERYLDELFDLLSGTGAAGRRLLAEAEEHLTEAAADGRARGLDTEAAQREAVARFGPAAAVARGVPAVAGSLSVRRLATAAWALIGAVLLWYGLSGALTSQLSLPWTRLLVATDRFGAYPMCGPWPEADCVALNRLDVIAAPGGLPYLAALAAGVVLLAALLVLRRTTALGTPAWTPPRRATALAFAVPFGLAGPALLIEAADGVTKDVQYYVLADVVAGLLALVVGVVALTRARRRGRAVA